MGGRGFRAEMRHTGDLGVEWAVFVRLWSTTSAGYPIESATTWKWSTCKRFIGKELTPRLLDGNYRFRPNADPHDFSW